MPYGVGVKVFPDHENGHGYVVDQLRLDERYRYMGAVIDIDPDFVPESGEPLNRRDVATFTLRAIGVGIFDVADIQGVGYRQVEDRSRSVCLALGATRVADAGLAQGTAAAIHSGLFKPQRDTLATGSLGTLREQFDRFRTERPKVDLASYMLDLQQPSSVALSPQIERLWRNRGHWFGHYVGVHSRAELMMQWQLEELRLFEASAA